MINELIFGAQILSICLFLLFSLRMGKEALIAFISVQYILANMLVLKQTTLFGLEVTCTDPFTVGAMLGLNMVQEYYGKETTRKTIGISLLLLIFYTLMTVIHLQYLPSEYDTMHPHYGALLGFMPRIAAASLIVYYLVQQIDMSLFGYLKARHPRLNLELRSAISTGISQLIDTVLFTFLGLHGLIANPWHIIFMSYAIKLITLTIAIPFVGIAHQWIRKED